MHARCRRARDNPRVHWVFDGEIKINKRSAVVHSYIVVKLGTVMGNRSSGVLCLLRPNLFYVSRHNLANAPRCEWARP